MKVIIAGSRTITHYEDVWDAVKDSGFGFTEVVSGGAKGVDQLGEQWAHEHGVPIVRFIPEWTKYGHAAGPMRNDKMARYAEALVAVWDGESRGTKNMIELATRYNLKVYVSKLIKEQTHE